MRITIEKGTKIYMPNGDYNILEAIENITCDTIDDKPEIIDKLKFTGTELLEEQE